MTESTAGYVLDGATQAERDRLAAQSALWDPFTFRMLDETGVSAGWHCLEIGAGTGSVAAWLLRRVAPGGYVVATDIETRWLEPLASPNLEVRHHNVAADPLDAGGYDLIHARLVIEHLPQRDAVVAKLVAALRPGGWLVVDDYDLCTIAVTEPADPAWHAVCEAVVEVLRSAGADPYFGRKLPAALRDAGLSGVTAEASLRPARVPDLAPALLPFIERLRERLVATGAVDDAQLQAVVEEFGDEGSALTAYTPVLVSARGRRRP